jgi:hypothetical protein
MSSAAVAQEPQLMAEPDTGNPHYFSLGHRSADQIDPADAALVTAHQHDLSADAALFGYVLGSGDWTYDQTLCPDIPDYLVLHYRRHAPNGTLSQFTALVPRGEGRVMVVPVLYRNATPYQHAGGGARTIAVFNRVVPSGIERDSATSNAKWVHLGMTYAAIAGAEPKVPARPDLDPAIMRAPLPTIEISSVDHVQEVVFTDRDAPDHFTVWDININQAGHVVSASVSTHPLAVARITPSTPLPSEKLIPNGPAPAMKPIPAAAPPVPLAVPRN